MAQPGRHFLHVPGPTNLPDRVLRAMSAPAIDHRGPEFADLAREVLAGLRPVCQAGGPVVVYPSSGTGALEAALVNTLSAGDRIVAFDTGHFAALWRQTAERFGLRVDVVPSGWGHSASPERLHDLLARDQGHEVRAVTVVHNETSTGVLSSLPELRRAMDEAGHPALLLVDAISSLGSVDYRHDEWGVDVTTWCSQKGMMLPAGLGMNAVSAKALDASQRAGLPRSYWDWAPYLDADVSGSFPYTPAANLLYGLREVLAMFAESGLPEVFARHARHAEAARRAVRGWGRETVCREPAGHSPTVTAVRVPDGVDADGVRKIALDRFNLSLGGGLGQLGGRAFRIGHLGDLGDLSLAGALAGVQMALRLAGVPLEGAGVEDALDFLSGA